MVWREFRRGAQASSVERTEDVGNHRSTPTDYSIEQHGSITLAFVLYHGYLHALGNRFHDAHFRNLELAMATCWSRTWTWK